MGVSVMLAVYHLSLQGFAEDDVYLCESRYSYKPKVMKKIKVN